MLSAFGDLCSRRGPRAVMLLGSVMNKERVDFCERCTNEDFFVCPIALLMSFGSIYIYKTTKINPNIKNRLHNAEEIIYRSLIILV